MTPTEAAILLFAATNSARVLAYLPQIVALWRDRSGASAVSRLTWGLFTVSNAATAQYALLVLDDGRMAAVFVANTLCSAVILCLAVANRAGLRSGSPPRQQRLRRPARLDEERSLI